MDDLAPVTFGWIRAADTGLTFRAVADADLPFLARLYASTRVDELAAVPWSAESKTAFLDMQFRAQHAGYLHNYPDADRLVLMHTGQDVGRLYLERGPKQHGIIDIALLPEHRGRGLGAALLRDLQDEAACAGKTVAIHVEKFNPAMRLYRRLGFKTEAEGSIYDLMRWAAAPA
jgi:ribosomal protein S18 acetylase RimI-like enzyme